MHVVDFLFRNFRDPKVLSIGLNDTNLTILQEKKEEFLVNLLQPQELDGLIYNSDSLSLIKTIEAANSLNITCEQRVSYLSDLQGRTETSIFIKNFTLKKLYQTIQTIKQQLKTLKQKVKVSVNLITNIGVESLRRRLNNGIDQMSYTFNNLNRARSLLQIHDNRINESISFISAYRDQIDDIRKQDIRKNAKNQLLVQNTTMLLIAGSGGQDKEPTNGASITALQIRLNEQLKYLINMEIQRQVIEKSFLDSKQAYENAEKYVKQMKDELLQGENRLDQLQKDLQNLKNQVIVKEKQVSDGAYSAIKIQSFLQTTQGILKLSQQRIDNINFHCFQRSQLQSLKLSDRTLTIFPPKQFKNYLTSSYPERQNKLISISPIRHPISSISILNSRWLRIFGIPYNIELVHDLKSLVIEEDFTCLSPSKLETGGGSVSKITKKYIQVTIKQKSRIKLNLASCTRIESIHDLPQIGQKILFRGIKITESEYNIYKTTIF